MARCTVRLLGRFEVSADGRVVPVDAWRSRRAADLVKVLALAPSQAMHREQIMALLWPELGEEPAGANLRKAVHYARRAMGSDEAIRSGSGLLSLWDGQAEVDAVRFLTAADAALASGDRDQCAHAADLYAGEPLPADRYEPWAAEPRRRLRERLLAVLKGAGLWQRVLDLDPTDERSHRELMRAYLRNGERRDAIRQFERLRDVLREHVGVGPDPETIALYERVLGWEGEPPQPEQRIAALVATGLVHLHRQEFARAEQLARQAMGIAVDAGLSDEAGDAGTLLALVASWTGRWHEVFRQEFTASLRQPWGLSVATYDANLCFAEYHLTGATPGPEIWPGRAGTSPTPNASPDSGRADHGPLRSGRPGPRCAPPKAIRARPPHFCARRLTSTPGRVASRTRIAAAPR
jgi:DNA-binding SARP family transcriptional activator